MAKVLDTAQTTSSTFQLRSQTNHSLSIKHTGGTWLLQVMTPDGSWVTIEGGEFDESGAHILEGAVGEQFRLHGGTAGAEAWVIAKDGSDVVVV